jgi:hypothetical protein
MQDNKDKICTIFKKNEEILLSCLYLVYPVFIFFHLRVYVKNCFPSGIATNFII